MVVVLRWYYDGRDGTPILPELSGVFGPFPDRAAANKWISTASTWGGWGEYKYQVEDLHTPVVEDEAGST